MSQNRHAEVEGLFGISLPGALDRRADVIFVHGLGGHWEETWQAKWTLDGFWPRWLGKDHPDLGVWSLGYEAHSSAWMGRSMPLADRAVNALEHLKVNGLTDRPLLFITHSLGGILVKRMLRYAQDLRGGDLSRVLGVVFLATPHSGSGLASFSKVIPHIFRPSTLVYELAGAHPELRDLNTWYRNNYRNLGIRNKVFYETKRTWFLKVVQEDRADPGLEGVGAVPVPKDHFSICKPNSTQDLVYRAVNAFIQECLAPPPERAVAQTPPAEPSTKATAQKAAGAPPSKALALWQEKLDYFLEEEAKTADPAQKFSLRQQIEECKQKIREFGGKA